MESPIEAEERVVLVDAQGRDLHDPSGLLATAGKIDAHQRGLRHRAVSVFVFDAERLLLQQRAATKYHCAALWSNTCCTHPRPGETPAAAASRRLREEMGFECPLREAFAFTYRAVVGSGMIEHEFDHVFAGEWSGEPRPDVEEVAGWRWAEWRRLEFEVAAAPGQFTPWFRHCLARAIERRRSD